MTNAEVTPHEPSAWSQLSDGAREGVTRAAATDSGSQQQGARDGTQCSAVWTASAVGERNRQKADSRSQDGGSTSSNATQVAHVAQRALVRGEVSRSEASSARSHSSDERRSDEASCTRLRVGSMVQDDEARAAASSDVRSQERETAVKIERILSVAVDELPTAEVLIKGTQHGLKIDTCAACSIAGHGMARWGVKLERRPLVDTVYGLGDVPFRVVGVWRFTATTKYHQRIQWDALVVNGVRDEFILGKDFFEAVQAGISFATRELSFEKDGETIVLPFRCRESDGEVRVATIRSGRGLQVGAGTRTLLRVPVEAPDGEVGVFVPRADPRTRVLFAATLATVHNGQVTLPVVNATTGQGKIQAREALGTWVPLAAETKIEPFSGPPDRGRVLRWLAAGEKKQARAMEDEDKIDTSNLDQGDRDLILRLLRRYPQLMQKSGCPPPSTTGVRHHIPTGDAAPISQRRLRGSFAEQAVIKQHVDKMLEQGVVEMGNGAWAFPVVLVKKKDGSVRFCVDYRGLNAVTTRDVYPLPRIDETLEGLAGAQWFTTLDLQAGYWQVEVAEADKDKTAFVTREGLFRFKRMPFGLANAPSTFQRVMDCVLRGLLWESCLVYLDDIVVFSKGKLEQHVLDLAVVLERLAGAGMTLKTTKCVFAATEIEYLGHQMTRDGIRPLNRLVTAVRDFPRPRDTREVKRFVHLAGYYRRFVPQFGTRASALTKLLRKKVQWCWDKEQEDSFRDLKAALTEKPLLVYPDFALPFVLATDASVVGCGAALMQDHGEGLQPIAYASKTCSEQQTKYSVTELECLAVVWAVQLFRPYLYGRRFELVTDHSALQWLMKARELKGRLHRWALQLQEHDFVLVYRPGSSNVVPDALSRAPVLAIRSSSEQTEQLTDEVIKSRQSASAMCRQAVDSGKCRGRAMSRGRDGVVRVLECGVWKILLPAVLWPRVFKDAHDSIWSGHLRGPQTLARIKRHYWWPAQRSTVEDWVAGCQDCGSRKVRPALVVPALRSVKVGEIGDRWALDVAGPLPVTRSGNRFVIAAVEYVTKFVVAVAVPAHTADVVARTLMERVVFAHGSFRELLTDGAPEMVGGVVTKLVDMLQARQTNPVPYRPNLMGLVERYNRTWKDMVALYTTEQQEDWDEWLSALVYAYNSARHTSTRMVPYELMTGREARQPGDLLRADAVRSIDSLPEWHKKLHARLRAATEAARAANARAQELQAQQYDRRRRRGGYRFRVGDVVWVLRPPRGRGVTKLVHRWLGPAVLEEEVGYDNWRARRRDTDESVVTHVSCLAKYDVPRDLREAIAADVTRELAEDEASTRAMVQQGYDRERQGVVVAVRTGAQVRRGVEGDRFLHHADGRFFVEERRRRVRRPSGQYELEYEVRVLDDGGDEQPRWCTQREFDRLWTQSLETEGGLSGGEGE